MSAEFCEECGGRIRSGYGTEICYHCLAKESLHFLDDSRSLFRSNEPSKPFGLECIGDYEILGELGRGGMGVVYRARRITTNQVVALKFIHSGPTSSFRSEARFMGEIEAAAMLSHDSIVPILDVGRQDEVPFYTMKLVKGGSLRDVKTRRYDLEGLKKSVACLIKVAEAVHFAHEHGIIHRDLKPSNVLLDAAGEPYVSDFGLAKRLDDQSDLTLTGEVLGTPSFMAPEQAAGAKRNQTIAVDVYSLGAVLYHSITGKAPFAAATAFETLKQIESQEAVPPSQLQESIDRDLDTIVLKCLEKQASRRYSSALVLAEDLGRWLEGRPVLARRTPLQERVRKWSRRRPYAASLIVISILSLGLLGGQAWNHHRRSQKEQVLIQDLGRRLAGSLVASRLQIAEDWLKRGGVGEAIAHLAANLRDQPEGGGSFVYAKNLLMGGEMPQPVSPPLLHGDEIWSVAFHPDGDRIVTACFDGMGRIWSLSAPDSPLFELPHPEGVYQVDLDSTSGRVVTGSIDGTVRVWDLDTGEPVSRPLKHEGYVQVARFIEGGEHFVTACVGAVVRVWSVNEFEKPVAELRLPEEEQITHIASPIPGFRDRLIVGTVRGNLRIWQWTTGTVLREFSSGSPYISDCVFSPEGDQMLVLGNHDATSLWSTETWSRIAWLPHSADPWSAVYSSTGNILVTCGENGFYFWDRASGAAVASRSILATEEALSTVRSRIHASLTRNLWFTFNNNSVFFSDEMGHPSGVPALSIPAVVHDIDPDPYHDRIAVRTFDDWLQIWEIPEISNSDRVYRTPLEEGANQAQFIIGAQGETQLVVGAAGRPELRVVPLMGPNAGTAFPSPLSGRNVSMIRSTKAKKHIVVTGEDMWLRLYGFDDAGHPQGREILSTPGRHCVVSPNDRWGFTVNRNSRPTVFDLSEDRRPLNISSTNGVHRLCFSPDSQLLAMAGYDGNLDVFRLNDEQRIARFSGQGQQPEDLEISPDREILVVGYNDGVLAAFDLDRENSKKWERRVKNGILLLEFSPDGSQLAVGTATGTVEIRDPQSGERLSSDIRHRTAITELRFVADGRALLVGAHDRTLRFWDPTSGYPLTQSVHWDGSAMAVDVSADGRFYCFGVGEGQIEVRRVPKFLDYASLPNWLVPFMEAVGGFRLAGNDSMELISWEERAATMDAVREMDARKPLVAWAQSVMMKGETSSQERPYSEVKE